MGWVKVSDDFYDHGKFDRLSAIGVALWIGGLGYCNRNLTDGFISHRAARGLVNVDGLSRLEGHRRLEPQDAIDELVAVGLWHVTGHDCQACPAVGLGEYYFHDYLDHQPSRSDVLEARAQHTDRVRDWRHRKAAEKRAARVAPPLAPPVAPHVAPHVAPPPKSQVPSTRLDNVSQVPERASSADDGPINTPAMAALGVTDVGAVIGELERSTGRVVDAVGARRVALHLLGKAAQQPRSGQRYVLSAIRKSPFEVQQHIDEEGLAAEPQGPPSGTVNRVSRGSNVNDMDDEQRQALGSQQPQQGEPPQRPGRRSDGPRSSGWSGAEQAVEQ